MTFFRQYIAPLLVVLIFLVALLAVSARLFLPADMAQPAPGSELSPQNRQAQALASQTNETLAQLPPALSVLVHGLPADPAQSTQLSSSSNNS